MEVTQDCPGTEEGGRGGEVLDCGRFRDIYPESTKGLEDSKRRGSQKLEPAQHFLMVAGSLWETPGYWVD